MVTVYVWQPTTFFSLGGRNDFYQRNKTILDKISEKGNAGFQREMSNPYDLLKIEIVGDKYANTFFREFGHASIEVEYNGKKVYGSLYPSTSKMSGTLILPFMTMPSEFKSYEQDLENMQSRPDNVVKIKNLNSRNMYNFLTNLGREWGEYNLYTRNCSTLVMSALQVGSHNIEISTWGNVKYTASQFYDKAKEVFKLALLFTPMKDSKGNFQHGHYNYAWHTVKADPIKSLFGVFETIGGLTPYKAMNYAKFLRDEIG